MVWKTGRNAALGLATMLGTPSGTPDTTAVVPVGTIATFEDETQGQGEFIYLPGVASLAAGDMCTFDLTPGTPTATRLVTGVSNNTARPVAVAMQVITAAQYGWYQIGGVAIVNTVAGTVAGRAFANALAGQLTNTLDAGDQILNIQILTAVGTPAANKSYAFINRPCMQGNIT